MSTLAYAKLTSRREQAPPGTSSTTSPGVGSWVDTLAALVPAEVLAAHATIISFTTSTVDGTTRITAPGTLKGVFIALVVVSAGLYWLAHRGQWDRWDWGRVVIPPLAFVGWTMLQKPTAFDAVAPNLPEAPRFAIAVIGAIVLAAAAAALSDRADRQPPS